MDKRPKIKLTLTPSDKLLEFLGWTFLMAIWLMVSINYTSLPESIPIHYNGAGKADAFGGKGNIMVLPFIASFLFIGLTILNKFPQIFNYPTNITADNAFQQYTNATRMLRILKFVIVFIFGFIELQTIRHINGQTDGLGIAFLPLSLGLIFIPIIYFFIKSLKIKK